MIADCLSSLKLLRMLYIVNLIYGAYICLIKNDNSLNLVEVSFHSSKNTLIHHQIQQIC